MAGEPRRMPFVDDDAASRRCLERGPGLNGFRVALADGGRAGLAETRTDRPDHNGIDVCRDPRADRDDMPVPMHSAPDGVADRAAGPQEGRGENSGTVFTQGRPLDQVTPPTRPRIPHTLRGAGFVPRTEGEDRHTQDAP
ncbi:hypothetical protein ACFYZB_12685 [Streptomyces sp. NPDC001852]|uniref:hypothetical protein n=1 Tax=Streptomyces sp. NPDC001852 TaxID=3364619 RepID=UPI003691CB26